MAATIGELMKRATALRREILGLAIVIVLADGLTAVACIRLGGHPTMRMGFALALAVLVTAGSLGLGLRVERELVGVRDEAARRLRRDR